MIGERLVTGMDFARHMAFVLRCSAAATFSYMLASAIGLPHPVWAAMTGIIVSQEKLTETRSATAWRLAGTVIGIVAAVAIGSLAAPLGADVAIQIALAVGLCAIVARRYPALRVCMWTGPIVFLTASPEMPILTTGLYRGGEVLLGGLVGAALHTIAEAAIGRMFGQIEPDSIDPPAKQQ
ncbi:FUSC family protein [Agrobacterium rhizogenes]|nr:FUSC family protein [Rhizobium rhizogenes]NTF65875.1 FUSC family protein [Rhizobium rhizogenes]NTF97997.1 FUSC family protein [Rhizobium rhizogenes]NTG25205.1 FUSC family protein [Rhizobium rhizogenes]NTG39019.1 FUSC family protein [Rhizobium rhizogenes]